MASQGKDGEDPVTVGTYRPSEYMETEWQVVNDSQLSNSFVPAEFKQVGEATHPIDTMFSDFGNSAGATIELSREAGDFDLQQVEVSEHSQYGYELAGRGVPYGGTVEAQSQTIRTSETSEQSDSPQGVPIKSVVQASSVDDVSGDSSALQTDGVAGQGDATNQFDEESVREALQQAYEQGCADTRQEVVEIQQQLEERYRLLWEDMQVQLDEAQRANEAKAVDLALQVAKRLVGDVVDTKRDYIIRVIQEAIKLTTGAQISSVRVSPQDHEFLKLEGYGDKTKAIAGEYLSFVSDDSIRAGCILVTSAGEVDFDLGKTWERIRAKVLQEPEQ